MNFSFDNQYVLSPKLFRDFVEQEVKPLAQEIDETERFPEETVGKMTKLGRLGLLHL
ncbi:acyl-CoA dehydrogenase family protein [Pseudoflavonifractor phocaeensis]|uniref:acyl-CoA dehydrogenase family protein n=1 Tax=Oscillospiraceae TaxID=216572 RepID=UPI001FAFE194|nr:MULTISPECIES: acyl-CoA dehydrogenase family protein [Oscillospiraceae]